MNIKRFAFTLAEVLITLGIIGIVAQMTIPTLYRNIDKQVTVTKMQKFYSFMNQAISLSEIDNGPVSGWDTCAVNSGCELTWFNTYLAKYIKYLDAYQTASNAVVILADGTAVTFKKGAGGPITIGEFLNAGGTQKGLARDKFNWFLYMDGRAVPFTPYDWYADPAKLGTRDYWTSEPTYGCNATATTKIHCAGLIMYDGWQIKSDYPYFN